MEDTGGAVGEGDKVGNKEGNKEDEGKGIVSDIDEEAMKLAIELGNKQNEGVAISSDIEAVENDLGESKVSKEDELSSWGRKGNFLLRGELRILLTRIMRIFKGGRWKVINGEF